jgi:Rps23 Pro-64 3,4-dihydroxylase Tpa1-like proline 4-hydroxylase
VIDEPAASESLARSFRRDGGVEVTGLLEASAAERLYKFVTAQMPADWWFASVLPAPMTGGRADLRTIPQNAAAIAAGRLAAAAAFARGEFAYSFSRTNDHVGACSCPVCAVIAELSSSRAMQVIGQITGRPVSSAAGFFASRYVTGDFLSPHTDSHNGDVGIVVSLTKDWAPQFGGMLHLLAPTTNGRVERVIVPSFNVAYLFDIPGQVGVPHFVSHVAPCVAAPRLAISGWYVSG